MNINKQKLALVSGASKGMGRAISFALVKEQYTLIACARSQESLDQLKEEILKEVPDGVVLIRKCDFSDASQIRELLSWVDTNSFYIDVLVNNVGLFVPGSILDEADGMLVKHMQANLFAAHSLSVSFGRKMRERKSGHIFNISSVASRISVPTAGSYSVTKYALAGLTDVLREELKKHNVKVTEIIPGSTLTSSWEGTTVSKDEFVLPEDVAQALVAVLKMSMGANVDEIVIKPIKGQI